MTKIYLIRHAEAEGNLYRRVQGQHNGDITPRGELQIAALAERFRDVPIDALYASNLIRTQKTAGAILKYHDLPLQIEPRLKEIGMGIWEDVPWGNVARDYHDELLKFSTNPVTWKIEGCELFCDLTERIKGIISEISRRHEGQTIAIVSHGMAIRSFLAYAMGIPPERVHEISHGDNTSVALIYAEKDSLDVRYHNDVSHLGEGLSTFAAQSWWKEKNNVDYRNLCFYPLSMPREKRLYSHCYKEGWERAHGTIKGYSPEPYESSATAVSQKDPVALQKAYCAGEFAGIVELDPERMKDKGAGWISFIYITPELRGAGLAVELIGHAVSYYKKKGRASLRLHVSTINEPALKMYKRLGFVVLDTVPGNVVPLYLLEKKF